MLPRTNESIQFASVGQHLGQQNIRPGQLTAHAFLQTPENDHRPAPIDGGSSTITFDYHIIARPQGADAVRLAATPLHWEAHHAKPIPTRIHPTPPMPHPNKAHPTEPHIGSPQHGNR